MRFLVDQNEDIKVETLKNAHNNIKLMTPEIHKDIVRVATIETINVILRDLRNELFFISVDESFDLSGNEQTAIIFSYVDKKMHVIEHVSITTALSLKATIDGLFSKHGLSMFRLHGQGYDGASNMQGEFNTLKTLIVCLQLALAVVEKNHIQIVSLFNVVANVVNVVGTSFKRHDILHDKQVLVVIRSLNRGLFSRGQGLNQETTLKVACDTR